MEGTSGAVDLRHFSRVAGGGGPNGEFRAYGRGRSQGKLIRPLSRRLRRGETDEKGGRGRKPKSALAGDPRGSRTGIIESSSPSARSSPAHQFQVSVAISSRQEVSGSIRLG